MIYAIIEIFYVFNLIAADLISNPVVSDQPHITISQIKKTKEIPEVTEKDPQFKILLERILWLDFGMSYKSTPSNHLLLLVRHFNRKGKIVMKKFQRKTFWETYIYSKSKSPKEISVPVPGSSDEFKGFKLMVCNFYMNKDFKILEESKLHITLFVEIESDEETTISAIKKAVMCLKDLLEITDETNPNDFAYQFSVETTTNQEKQKGKASKIVYTNMFKVIFEDDGCGVKLEYVDPYYYHSG